MAEPSHARGYDWTLSPNSRFAHEISRSWLAVVAGRCAELAGSDASRMGLVAGSGAEFVWVPAWVITIPA